MMRTTQLQPRRALIPEAYLAPHSPSEPSVADWVWKGHIPGLDGLRALAILMVVLSHAVLTHGFPAGKHWHWCHRCLGASGVTLFFVISGFLITLLLLRERQRSGTVSLRGFYWRRSLRILPAYVAFLAGVFLWQCWGLIQPTLADWLCALTYTMSFRTQLNWELGHIWSLSVEEHFYLVWPVLVWLAPPRRLWLVAGAGVVGTVVLRFLVSHHLPNFSPDFCTLTRADGMAIGCGLALLAATPAWQSRLVPRGLWAAAMLLLAGGVLTVNWFVLPELSWTISMACRRSVEAVAFAAIIWVCVHQKGGLLGWLLAARPLVAIGTLSYSLYLWQQLFFHPKLDTWFTRWPTNLFLAGAAAVLSYYLVEAPFLRLKARAPTPPATDAPDRDFPAEVHYSRTVA